MKTEFCSVFFVFFLRLDSQRRRFFFFENSRVFDALSFIFIFGSSFDQSESAQRAHFAFPPFLLLRSICCILFLLFCVWLNIVDMNLGKSATRGARGATRRVAVRRVAAPIATATMASSSSVATTTTATTAPLRRAPLLSSFLRSSSSSSPRVPPCAAAPSSSSSSFSSSSSSSSPSPSPTPPTPSKEQEDAKSGGGFWPSGAKPLPSSLGWPAGFDDSFDLADPGTKLGSGSYAQVYLGRDRKTGEEVAIKVIPKRRPPPPKKAGCDGDGDGDDSKHPSFKRPPPPPRLPLDSAVVLQRLQREADLLSRVSGCGNVGALRAVHESDDAAFVVLSFVDGGDLEALVTRRREQRREEELVRAWEERKDENGEEDSGEDLWAAEEREKEKERRRATSSSAASSSFSSSASSSSPPPTTSTHPHSFSQKLLFTEKEAAVIMFELFKALVALHYNSVLHGGKKEKFHLFLFKTRTATTTTTTTPHLFFFSSPQQKKIIIQPDIKPANVMLDSAATRDALSGKWSRPFLRLADFGLGRACAPQQKVAGTRGTPVFMAPEVFRGSYGQKADVFAAGVTLYYLLSGRYPYFATFEEVLKLTPRAVRARALAGEESWKFDGATQQPFASRCSALCRDLLSSLLDRDEGRRPSALEALGHPWFAEQLPPEPALLREAEERRRREEEEEKREVNSLPFGLSSSSSATAADADALSPPPLALPPGVAAVSAILAHSSMSACADCDMACCPLSGGRVSGLGAASAPAPVPASLSRLVDGGEGFSNGGGEACDLSSSSPAAAWKVKAPSGVHQLEPPEVDEH